LITGFPEILAVKSTDAGRRTGRTKATKGTRRGRR